MLWAPRLYQCFLMSFVIKNWILYSLQFSLSRLCATALTNKVFLSQTLGTKKSSIMYGFRSDILFPIRFCHLIYACLCGSIALILQYKDKVTQRHGMKRLFEVISKAKLIQLPGTSTERKCFPLFWIPLLFLDAAGNEDVEMASQNPGIVQLQVEAPAWTGVWLHVILSVQEGAHIDLTLIFRGDGNSASWLKCNSLLWFSLQLSLIKDPPRSVLLAAEE